MASNTVRKLQVTSLCCDRKGRIIVYGWLLILIVLMSWTLPILAADTPPTQTHFERGQQALRAGQTGDAERHYLRALYQDDQHLAAYLALADLYLVQGRHSDVQQVIDKAMTIYPDNAKLWARQGLVSHRLGRADAARQAYQRAVDLAPDDPDILQQAAGIYYVTGNRAKAEELSQARRALAAKRPIDSQGNRNMP